jgi:phosphoglycolate phosphatase-like HAD superfamily hydrolase
LIDRARLNALYPIALGAIMSERYGGSGDQWRAAYQQIVTDWDSYYADLDLGGDDGIADLWEGLFRTTRALFRLTATLEPSHSDLIAFSRELPALVYRDCPSHYPDVPLILNGLSERGITVGICADQPEAHARALIGPFDGPIIGVDTLERAIQDSIYFQRLALHSDPAVTLIIHDQARVLAAAKRVGFAVFHFVDRPLEALWQRLNGDSPANR